MKKISMRIISLLLACVSAALACCISAGAVPAVFKDMGDVGLDGALDITDATHIQRSLASLEELDLLQRVLADVNGNGEVDIMDATGIQRHLAGLEGECEFALCQLVYYYVSFDECAVEWKGEEKRSGSRIAFSPTAYTDPRFMPVTYEYRLNGELVREADADPVFSYTFGEPGEYRFEITACNAVGQRAYKSEAFHILRDRKNR